MGLALQVAVSMLHSKSILLLSMGGPMLLICSMATCSRERKGEGRGPSESLQCCSHT
jgi:hypothetical protein